MFSDGQLLCGIQFQELQSSLPLMRLYSAGTACPVATGLPVTNLIDRVCSWLDVTAMALASRCHRLGQSLSSSLQTNHCLQDDLEA